MNKSVRDAREAIADVQDGATIMMGGFGICGIPENLINAIREKGIKNLTVILATQERKSGVSWEVLPGLGVRVSETNRPEPDVLILPKHGRSADPQGRDRSDVFVAFEILSPSTTDRDLRWKRTAYTSLPSLTHYVVIAQDAVDIVVFARETGFAEQRLQSLDDSLELPALGISLLLAEIYRDIDLR